MIISDHAVLRYLERRHGLDVEKVREEMNSPALEIADAFGCPVVIGKYGQRLLIRDGVVVTTLPKRHGKMAKGER